MKIDVKFSNAKVYDVNTFDVAKGEKFSILTDYTQPSKWFSDNDPVLSMKVAGDFAEMEALETGASTLLIMDGNFGILKQITINVLEEIVDPATDINVKGGEPLPK